MENKTETEKTKRPHKKRSKKFWILLILLLFIVAVSATTLSYQDGSQYAIGDAAIYSKNSDNTYMLLKKADISPATHTITAYYDRSLSAGGKIRVIIAEEK